MTNQVTNVTENENEVLSNEDAYDAEWDNDDDSDLITDPFTQDDDKSVSDSTNDVNHGNAEEAPTESGTVADETQDNLDKPTEGSAESSDGGDIWANASESQKLAFKQAQNDLSRETGRAKSQQQLNASLQKELENRNALYAEETREKGAYETEHPELFNEVLGVMESRNGLSQSQADVATDSTGDNPEDIQLVFKVHPDAHDLMQTPEWGNFAGNLNAHQTKQLNSDDPFDFIDLMSEYKTQKRVSAHNSSGDLEDTLTSSSRGSGSSASAPNRRNLSVSESYDAEWELD